MKELTKLKLKEAEDYANKVDMSTEMMIQYMQDSTGLSFDCVMKYINETWTK